MNIHYKLQQCRVELQNMKIKKSGKNKFAGFDYFELSDFLPFINSLFLKYKLCSNFSIEGNVANLIIYDCEDDVASIIYTCPTTEIELKGCTPIQCTGALITYMKRYLYLNALEIVENDMLDAQIHELDEKKVFAEIEKCDNLETLNKVFKKYEGLVADRDKLVKACSKKKGELNNGGKTV